MASIKVLDVSHHNVVQDWGKVARDVDAVIIRAGYRGYGKAGTLATDKKFKSYIEGAIKAGIPVGVYWCSQALSDVEAQAEAVYCHKLIAPYKLQYPVYLDSEHMGPGGSGRADRIGKARRTQYGLAFCRAMKAYGNKVGLYCSESWYTAEIDGPLFAATGFATWVAKYSSSKPSMPCDAWQYTSKGKVSGVSGNVDLSHFYVDYGADDYREAVKKRFGFSDGTLDYLGRYQYGAELLRKLATMP